MRRLLLLETNLTKWHLAEQASFKGIQTPIATLIFAISARSCGHISMPGKFSLAIAKHH